MAELSLSDIRAHLLQAFGPTLPGGRDEGMERMTDAVADLGHDRAGVEAALAEMVEAGTIRYLSEPVGGVGAGIEGVLDAPSASDFGMTDGRPPQGVVVASQQHGSGYWDLSGEG